MFKVRFALLLASVSISLTYALDICENQLNGVRLAHPADCNKFVVCKDGQTQSIRNCPIGLHFNRFKGVCDLKERAACDFEFRQFVDNELDCSTCCAVCGCDGFTPTPENPGTPTPENPGTPTPENPGTPTPENPGTPTPENPGTPTPENPGTPTPENPGTPTPENPGTPTPENPGTPTPENPGTPTPENPGTPTPENPGTPTPENPGTPTPENPGTPTPENPGTPTPETPGTPGSSCLNDSTICVDKPDGSVSYVNGTCRQYVVCIGGCGNILSCPNNLQYNLTTHQCDYPQNVDCPWESQPPITGPSGVTCAQHGECLGKPDGTMLPDPNSDGYIVCQCECEIERRCAAGTKYNATLEACVHINNDSGNDNGNGNGYGNNKNAICTNNDIKDCQDQTDGTLLPVNGECNKFYTCVNGCAVVNICPNNLIYNPTKDYCDYPQNYKCPWPYTPPSGPTAGPSGIACASGGRCIGKPDGTFFPSNTNQSKYVICQCECEVEMNCPVGLIWNMQQLACNWPPNLE